jgi:hypothetical protein
LLSTRNLLLNSLSSADLNLLTPSLSLIKLALRANLEEPNRPIKTVYFIEEGIASVVAASAAHREVEVGLIGCEA